MARRRRRDESSSDDGDRRRRRPRTGGEDGGRSFWDKYGPPPWVSESAKWMASPVGRALDLLSDDPRVETPGRALMVLGSGPAAPVLGGVRTPEQGWETIRGAWESIPLIYGSVRREGWWDTMDMIWEATKADYAERYGDNWVEAMRENPLSNFFDALTVLGVTARGTALAGSAGRLIEADKSLLAAAKPGARWLGPAKPLTRPWRTNIWQESKHPGLYSEGEAWKRQLWKQTEEGPTWEAFQPWSASPVRRGAQALADVIAAKHPDAPVLGAGARIARSDARLLSRAVDRLLGSARHVDAVNSLPEAGRTRLYWGAQLGNHTNGALQELRDVLARSLDEDTEALDNMVDPDFAEALKVAKKSAFMPRILERLDKAIAYTPDAQYERAVKAMQDMTEISESVIADANGFTSLANDLKRAKDRLRKLDPSSAEWEAQANKVDAIHGELINKADDLEKMFKSRRRRLLDWVKFNKHVDTPERRAWMTFLTAQFGPEQAQMMIRFADGLANVKKNPERFWRERIGMPQGESAEEFMARVGEDALFQRFGPYGEHKLIIANPDTAFYSPLQRWVEENWPRKNGRPVPAKELEDALRKHLRPEEYEIANLDQFFHNQRFYRGGDGGDIPLESLQSHLASPLNSYNLSERHFVNTAEAEEARFGTAFNDTRLLSRNPDEGEYHELVFHSTRADPAYSGTGYSHWGRDNVAFHVRFQVFREDGKLKLLIEEIQSDWASDFRRAGGREGQEMRRIAYEQARQTLGDDPDLRQRLTDLEFEQNQIDQDAWTIYQNWARYWEGMSDADLARFPDAIEARNQYRALMRRYEAINGELEAIAPDPPPPFINAPPWGGERYLNVVARRLMRYADENNVDEIILTDPSVQRIRNAENFDELPLGRNDAPIIKDPRVLRAALDESPDPKFGVLYGSKIKKVFDRELGAKGAFSDAAYEGRYSGQLWATEGIEGDMRGLVWKVTPEVIERARAPQAIFQRQPDWDALPRGATELLKGGGTNVHIFKDGNVSTWIHELGHVALHDLDGEDLGIVQRYYAGGRRLEDWKDADHENFARDWERWVREGEAPHDAMRRIFEKLSEWMKAVLTKEEEIGRPVPDEIREVFERMFRAEGEPSIFIPHRPGSPNMFGRVTKGIPRAQRILGDQTVSRIPLFKRNNLGLIRSGMIDDDPRHLIEHVNRIVMLARANQLREAVLEMGTELLPDGTIPGSGGLGPDFTRHYVIKRAGSGVDDVMFDAVEKVEDPESIRRTVAEFIDDHITDSETKFEAWKGESQLYVVDKRMVDMLFKNVTGKTPGATTKPGGTMGAVIDAGLDSMRALLLYANPGFYMSNMVGNAWMMLTSDPRASKHMLWSMKNAIKAAKIGEDRADPLWEQISIEMGRGPTSGGISFHPEFVGAGPERTGRIVKRGAESVSYGISRWGRRAGRVIDDSFRVAAWRQAAAKRGYDTEAKMKKLLDDAAGRPIGKRDGGTTKDLHKLSTKEKHDLAAIRDEAENLMLDFDSMTPFERTYLQRLIFLYPFLRASTKYPIMFAGERPITAGLLGQAGLIGTDISEEMLGPRPNLPAWAQGYARGPGGWLNIGQFSPYARALDLQETLMGIGQPTEIGVDRPYALTNPLFQTLISALRSQNKYGRDAPFHEIIRSDFPTPSWISALYRNPSALYGEPGGVRSREMAAFLRSLRVVPFKIYPEEGEEQATSSRGRRRRR